MRQRKTHIAPLAFLMLILFVSPIAVKALHYDSPIHFTAKGTSQGKSFSAAIEPCAVCQFEFVTFIACIVPEYTPPCLPSSVFLCEAITHNKGIFFAFYSLRAPPLY